MPLLAAALASSAATITGSQAGVAEPVLLDVQRLDLQRVARDPPLARLLATYLLNVERAPRRALELCMAAAAAAAAPGGGKVRGAG